MADFLQYLKSNAATKPEDDEQNPLSAATAQPSPNRGAIAPPKPRAPVQPKLATGVGLAKPAAAPKPAGQGPFGVTHNTGAAFNMGNLTNFLRANMGQSAGLAKAVVAGDRRLADSSATQGEQWALGDLVRAGGVGNLGFSGNTDYSQYTQALDALGFNEARGKGLDASAAAANQAGIRGALANTNMVERSKTAVDAINSGNIGDINALVSNTFGNTARDAGKLETEQLDKDSAAIAAGGKATGTDRGNRTNRAEELAPQIRALDEEIMRKRQSGQLTPEEAGGLDARRSQLVGELQGLGVPYDEQVVKGLPEWSQVQQAQQADGQMTERVANVWNRSQEAFSGVYGAATDPRNMGSKSWRDGMASAKVTAEKMVEELDSTLDTNVTDPRMREQLRVKQLETLIARIEEGWKRGEKTGLYVGNPKGNMYAHKNGDFVQSANAMGSGPGRQYVTPIGVLRERLKQAKNKIKHNTYEDSKYGF